MNEKRMNNKCKMSDITTIQKPFLKWVGGKTQILNDILSKIPQEMENYHELFLGGGSVLLAVLSLQRQNKITIKGKIYAYDINIALINVYKHIQHNKDELYAFINHYITEYDSIQGTTINRKAITEEEAKTSKESYYYWTRHKFNNILDKNTIEYSALFMFLNKTCFRGVYREGPHGFNVPYGHYKTTPTIITETELNHISELIKDVEFQHSDFRESIQQVKAGDFVYLDPPYAPETATSFVGYVADGFSLDMHKSLFSEIKKMGENNVKIVMSNAKVDLVVSHFKDTNINTNNNTKYTCEDIIARRAIHSKKPDTKTTEVIIYN